MARDRFNRPQRKSKLKRLLFALVPVVVLFGGKFYLQSTGQEAVIMQKVQRVIGGVVERQMERQDAKPGTTELSQSQHPELR